MSSTTFSRARVSFGQLIIPILISLSYLFFCIMATFFTERLLGRIGLTVSETRNFYPIISWIGANFAIFIGLLFTIISRNLRTMQLLFVVVFVDTVIGLMASIYTGGTFIAQIVVLVLITVELFLLARSKKT